MWRKKKDKILIQIEYSQNSKIQFLAEHLTLRKVWVQDWFHKWFETSSYFYFRGEKRAFIFMTSCRMWLYKKTYDQIRLALPWWRSALHWGRSILIIENLNGEAEPSCAGRRCGQTAISPPGVWRPGDRLENNSFKFWHGDPLYIPSPRPTLCPPALPDKTRHETDKAGWNYSTHLVQSLLRGGEGVNALAPLHTLLLLRLMCSFHDMPYGTF